MIEEDLLYRFVFEEAGIRGEWVKLGPSLQASCRHQQGPGHVQQLLGQALAAVVMLTATVKFKGSMILQAQGQGDIRAVVAQSTHDKKIRGLLRSNETVPAGTLQDMFGQGGRLVITIESDNADPYQGITALQGYNLAAALETYFTQSEQLNTRLWLFASEHQAAGLLIQELPEQTGYQTDWEHIEMLANTVTDQELIKLNCEQLLHRLFHEEKIRLFEPEPIQFKCTCSRQKIEDTLRALGKSELYEILKTQSTIEVDCEFCREHYSYDAIDIKNLMSDGISPPSDTRH
ncbi:MAG: Hsp33 family molecular chaperone HslO [Methylococcaceae bacterium]|nr:Hsp33 family molecular chaperone HslO [Methylococcaceae bacterium]